ncbi:MAG: hypothetical protein WCA08_25580 [Desulfoferrobacter sp.]
MVRCFLRWTLILLFLAAMPFSVLADEITDQIKEGLESYEKGDYSEAVSTLNFAVGQIQQKQASGLKKVFPEPLQGWQAQESTGDFASAAFMGGGVSASRHSLLPNLVPS